MNFPRKVTNKFVNRKEISPKFPVSTAKRRLKQREAAANATFFPCCRWSSSGKAGRRMQNREAFPASVRWQKKQFRRPVLTRFRHRWRAVCRKDWHAGGGMMVRAERLKCVVSGSGARAVPTSSSRELREYYSFKSMTKLTLRPLGVMARIQSVRSVLWFALFTASSQSLTEVIFWLFT